MMLLNPGNMKFLNSLFFTNKKVNKMVVIKLIVAISTKTNDLFNLCSCCFAISLTAYIGIPNAATKIKYLEILSAKFNNPI